MKCPLCKTINLQSVTLEEHLEANACKQCSGYWIPSEKYGKWLERQETQLPEKQAEVYFEVRDSQRAKLCPQCHRILIKYRVGRGVDFFLDHCNSCNGVWFDKNEWEVLKSRNLHDEVHYIFTKSWQAQIRQEDVEENLDRMYETKFGQEDYTKLQEIRAWLKQHPQSLALLAYLNDENPYHL